MMEIPQLHGLGPAANRLLESYKLLLKVSTAILCFSIMNNCINYYIVQKSQNNYMSNKET